ncbi:MAG: hypothetical protein AB7R69_00730 [Candidatus Babeliales bacterium]
MEPINIIAGGLMVIVLSITALDNMRPVESSVQNQSQTINPPTAKTDEKAPQTDPHIEKKAPVKTPKSKL